MVVSSIAHGLCVALLLLQAQNTLLKNTQCGLKVLFEQMDAAQEEVAMWEREAEVREYVHRFLVQVSL